METYGVSFEGFEPWCGKDLYEDVVSKKIPAAEETLAGARKSLAEIQQAVRSVEELRKPMLGLKTMAEKTADIVGTSVVAHDTRMNELLRTGSEEAQTLLKGYEAFFKWLQEGCLPFCGHLEGMYSELEEIAQNDFAVWNGLIDEMTVKRDFWTLVAETAKIDHVYEHADAKYRAKICRDAVRDLTLLLEKGRAYEAWLKNSHIPYSEEEAARQIKNVRNIMTQTQNTLVRYRKQREDVKRWALHPLVDHGVL